MCASYARQHQRKQQGVLNQFNSVGGGDQALKRMTSEERKNLISDKDAYLEYLESQLDKVCQHSIAENPQMQRRITELEDSITQHEEKFANMTKLIQLLQTFAEAQEDENRLVKEQMNKPLSLIGKKMDNLQADVVGDLNQKLMILEEKETQREIHVFEALASFQNTIHDFENKIESFANQLSRDMASDIKTLAEQVKGPFVGASQRISGDSTQSGDLDGVLKKGLDKIREEVNRKIDYVMKEMRKNALISEVEGFEEKLKKEQKERTYLCKFVEDLTRKIDECIPALASRKNTSRNVSPSTAAQDSNQFKLIRQVESDIEDLKEVVNALVDKIEDLNKVPADSFITKEQFQQMEKSLSEQIFKQTHENRVTNDFQIIGREEEIANGLQGTRSQPNLLSDLKSNSYLIKSPMNDSNQQWNSQQAMEQQYQTNNKNNNNNQFSSFNRQIYDDQDLKDTLISHSPQSLDQQQRQDNNNNNYNFNNVGAQNNNFNSPNNNNNLGESFGLNQNIIKATSASFSVKNGESKKEKNPKKTTSTSALDQYPSKERKKSISKDTNIKRTGRETKPNSRLSSKENRSNSWSSGRRGRKDSANTDTIKKNIGTSHSKSPSQIETRDVQSTKSAASVFMFTGTTKQNNQNTIHNNNLDKNHKKLSKSSQSLEGKLKSHSNRNSITEPDDRTNISQRQKINEHDLNNVSKEKSPSPHEGMNKYAEKKKAHGEKIKELFKKKKQIDSNSSHAVPQSSSQHKLAIPSKTVTQEKKKK